MSEPVHVIANPGAAGGKGARIVPGLCRRLEDRGIPYVLTTTEAPGHATELAWTAVEEGATRIVVVGGDGTLHEVVNGLAPRLASPGAEPDAAPAIVVCPMGTGNDFYRMVDAPSDVKGVVRVLESGARRAFDLGHVRWEGGEEYFVNLLGVGIDVELLRKRPRFRRLPGLIQYLAALGAAALSYRHRRVVVELESGSRGARRLEARVLLAMVTVGPSVGGGIRVSPGARADDGLLDLFLVEDLGLLGIARYLPRVLRGTHASVRQIHMHSLRRARIESSDGEPLHFELDGELMRHPSPWLEIEVVPERLVVLESPREPTAPHPPRERT